MKKSTLFILSGPSGVGKKTVLMEVKKFLPNFITSISATTRPPREDEENGVDYFFKTVDEFESGIRNNDFLEYVQFANNYYGTPKKFVFDHLNKGNDILLEIEVVGALKIMKEQREQISIKSIFVSPPSFDELKCRLQKRNTEDIHSYKMRMEKAKWELQQKNHYDIEVINKCPKEAALQISNILKNN